MPAPASAEDPAPALRRCVSLDPAEFAADVWGRAPLLTRGAGPFTDLLSPDDVDELVGERGLRTPFLRLVQDAEPLTGWTTTATAGSRRLADVVDPDKVRERFAAGATLVLQSLHRIHPPLGRFCRQLAADLGHPTQCNAYVTPPGDARGFAYHHDTHDVFVLQVDGRKRWQVHAPVLELPLRSQPRSGADLVPAGATPLLDVELGPGDVLYLPRGYVHAAATTDVRSLHLTVGVHAVTAYDVLQDLLALAADDVDFRRPLPVRPERALDATVQDLVPRAAKWLSDLPLDAVRDLLERRLARAQGPEPLGVLATTAATVDAETRVRPRTGLATALRDDGDRTALVLPDREISVPAHAGEALRRAVAGPARADDLALGDLDVAGALVLVRRLLREGVLVVEAR